MKQLRYDSERNGFVKTGDLACVTVGSFGCIHVKPVPSVSGQTFAEVPDGSWVVVLEDGIRDCDLDPWAKVMTAQGVGYVLQVWLRTE